MKQNINGHDGDKTSLLGDVATTLMTAGVVAVALPAVIPQEAEAFECKEGFYYDPVYNFCVPEDGDCVWCS